ncbi:MAG: response regulator [bacterium]|nr:response regulator [bacterium]
MLTDKLQPQNWAILQDQRGIIYVANQGGVLEFDGVTQREISLPNHSARSLAIDENGIIYVGGNNEFGFLSPGAAHSLQFVSLRNHLDDKKKHIGSVYRTYSTLHGVYFWTFDNLYRWNPASGRMQVWELGPKRFSVPFECNGKLFILRKNVGLMEMVNDSLELLPGTETFAKETIVIITPYDKKRLMIGTRSAGLFLYDGTEAIPFPTGVDAYLKSSRISYGIRLSASLNASGMREFAVSTLAGGLVIIDARGRLIRIFDKTTGLQDEDVKYVFEDVAGNLWLGLNNGIAKIEYASPFSRYDEKHSGLAGLVLCAARIPPGNELYAGTSNGLYRLTPGGRFAAAAGLRNACWSLVACEDRLLAAMHGGVYMVKKNGVERITGTNAYTLLRSGQDKNRVWVGTLQGLTSLYFLKNKWRVEYRFDSIRTQVRCIREDKRGNLWLGTLNEGVINVNFPAGGDIKNPVVTGYGVEQGLPAGEIFVFEGVEHFMFCTDKGVFRFNEKTKNFIPDTTLGPEFTGGPGGGNVFRMAKDKNNNIWFHSMRRNFQAIPRLDGTYHVLKGPFLRLPAEQTNMIYTDPDGVTTWFANHGNLVRFDTRAKKNYRYDFSTLIRRVRVNGSLFFDGYEKEGTGPEKKPAVFPYRDRNFRFEFAAPFFENESATRYRYYLEGYDEGWSDWSIETKKDFTNLAAGDYYFRVMARNVYNVTGREDVFHFRVLPPWYQTWWAYLIYFSLWILGVYLIVKWRSGKLVREKRRLEEIIEARTWKINRQKRQLEEQSEKLKEMDKVKSRFFANISHEFRTPLTLIMGPLEQMLTGGPEKKQEKKQEKKLDMMLRNCRRLLGLINQLLELSKFDSGKVKLRAAPQNIVSFVKGITASFEPLTGQRKQELGFRADEENIVLYFDPEHLEKVISNLLSNAVKFTPAGGNVTVSVKPVPVRAGFSAAAVEISVSDTGPGIPREQLANIFDRFYQAGSTYEHHHKGSGIGLAIVKELVDLHHGTIAVTANGEEGTGTTFVICLPRGNPHPGPDRQALAVTPSPGMKVIDFEEEPPGEDRDDNKEKAVIDEAAREEKNIVLVVEDSAGMREYIRNSLEPVYTVAEAKDGNEGFRMACRIVPDLVISDVMMPGMDGYELCATLKKELATSHIPVVLLTAKAAEKDMIDGLETGADDYITKPFNTRILLTRIKNLIDLRRGLQETMRRDMLMQPTKIAVSSIDHEFMKELNAVIEKNLSDMEFNVDALAKSLYISRATLNRKIRAITGESTNQYIQTYRLKRAAQLLKANAGNVTEVAFQVGFSNSNYFTKRFKEKFHRLPHAYQASEAGSRHI